MNQIKISELKSQLSHYLRYVQQGEEIIVTERNRPVARVIPFLPLSTGLKIRPAKKSPKNLTKIKIPKTPQNTNSLSLLREDRDYR